VTLKQGWKKTLLNQLCNWFHHFPSIYTRAQMASLKVCTINYALTSGIQLSVTVSECISSVHQMGSYRSPHEINKNVTLFLWQIMWVRAQTLDSDMYCHVKAEARLLPSQFEHTGICEVSPMLSSLPQKDSKSQCQISPYWCTIYRIGWHWGHSQIHSNMPKSFPKNVPPNIGTRSNPPPSHMWFLHSDKQYAHYS
jgi:hypothetical protein